MLSNDIFIEDNNSLVVDVNGKRITLRFIAEPQEDNAARVIQILTESYLEQLCSPYCKEV